MNIQYRYQVEHNYPFNLVIAGGDGQGDEKFEFVALTHEMDNRKTEECGPFSWVVRVSSRDPLEVSIVGYPSLSELLVAERDAPGTMWATIARLAIESLGGDKPGKINWISWDDGKWAIDTMKLESAQNNIAGTVIELEDGDWHCTLSFTIEAGMVGNFVKAKTVVEYLVKTLLRQL